MRRMQSTASYGAIQQEEPLSEPPGSPHVKKSSRRPALLHHGQLDGWRVDNEYILSGYRPNLGSYSKCVESIYLYWHNETLNIWTHLLGALVTLGVLLYLVTSLLTPQVPATPGEDGRQGWMAPFSLVYPFPSSLHPSVTSGDSISFVVFYLSALTCLGFSAGFHCLSAHSMAVAHQWNRFDYIGIVVLITGTFVPLIRYGFYCAPKLQHFYLGSIGIASACTIAVVVAPRSRTPEYRRFRTYIFISLGLSAVFPVGHGLIRYGLKPASDAIALPWLGLGGLLYILGALLYAERCPERLFPGTFDYVASSHQIFHVFILLAACAHACAIAEAFRFWHFENGGVCDGAIYR